MTARGSKRSPSGSVMPFAPMEPILSPALPRDPSYAFQVKWDGVRLVADVGPDGVRLWSKNGRDVTVAFPELVATLKPLGNRRRWLDGEAIVLDHAGRSSFSDAVRRIRVRDAAAAQQYARTWPACYAVFDCLRDGETVLFAEAWEARQEYLHNLIPVNSQALFAVETVRDGEALWNRVLAQGEEGVVAKRRQGRYVPGKTHGDWLKVKACREGVFAIVGLAEWAGRVRSVLLAERSGDGTWTYVGRVASGLSEKERRLLAAGTAHLVSERPPFRGAVDRQRGEQLRWLLPYLAARVQYREKTPDGRLRHPKLVGFLATPPDGLRDGEKP